jgi:hypothetical protein
MSAQNRVSHFLAMWDEKPLRGPDNDELYGIHVGTEWEAMLRISDLRKLSARVSELEKENRVLQIKAAGTLANNLCPEHRDKQTGKPCLACRVEKLEKALHSIYRRAELAEADGVHMRGALGNIREEARAILEERP